MDRTKENRLEEILWVALQAVSLANKEAANSEYYDEIRELRVAVSNTWNKFSDLVRKQIERAK